MTECMTILATQPTFVVLCVGHGQNFLFSHNASSNQKLFQVYKNSDSFQTLKIKALKFLLTLRFQDGKMCK